MLPALPTGMQSASIDPISSRISNDAVFWPSTLKGLTEFTRAMGCRSQTSRTSLSATSKFPRSAITRAPCISAWASLPVAIFPSGTITAPRRPAFAAYAAKAGLRGAVIVPEGKIATGKLAQALMHGARVIALRGNFDEALKLVREVCERQPIALVNSVNPFRVEGQKTASFEILDEIGSIDALCIPVGNAGNITAYWKGFQEYD